MKVYCMFTISDDDANFNFCIMKAIKLFLNNCRRFPMKSKFMNVLSCFEKNSGNY